MLRSTFFPPLMKEISGSDTRNRINDSTIETRTIRTMIWDAKLLTSISIKFVGGRYIVKKYQLTEEELKPSDTITKKTYIAHRLEGIHQLEFRQFWKEEKDEFCEDMTTLIPDKLVFVGFDNNKQGGQEI